MFTGPFDASIIKRAKEKGKVAIDLINIRDFGLGKHKVVDDTPYGGGIGMVMRVDVLNSTIEKTKCNNNKCMERIVLLSASGKKFNQQKAEEYSKADHIILICGHYEGIDERIKKYIDDEISIGDFVLTGGELPAMLITDAVVRLLPGVLKNGATENESFSFAPEGKRLLEYPQYTKPQTFEGHSVPEVLLNGNHKQINQWRLHEAKQKTENSHLIS